MNSNNKIYYQCTLVLVGDFQPAMFQPLWFFKNKVITETEYNAIISSKNNELIVNNSLTQFETDLLSFQINQKRFQILGKKEPFEGVVDAFKNIFNSLSTIPLKAYGINYTFHLEAEDERELERIGKRLAPREYWSSILSEDEDNQSGLVSLTMRKSVDYGQINITIESSKQVRGIYFNYNFHHSVVEGYDSFSTGDIERFIEEQSLDHKKTAFAITKDIVERITRYA